MDRANEQLATRKKLISGATLAGAAGLLLASGEAKAVPAPANGQGHYVDAYGAIGNGSTDDSAAINLAIAAAVAGANGSNAVILGAKTYRCLSSLSTVLNGRTIVVRGEGSQGANASILSFPDGVDGLVLDPGLPAHCHIVLRDFQVRSDGVTGNRGGVRIGNTTDPTDGFSRHVIENVYIEQFTVGLRLFNARMVACTNVVCRNQNPDLPDSNAFHGYYSGDCSFINCEFSTRKAGYADCVRLDMCSGFHYFGCHFYFGGHGLYIANQTVLETGDFFFDQCQFDGGGGPPGWFALRVHNLFSGKIVNVYLSKCWFYGYSQAIEFYSVPGGTLMNANVCHCTFRDHAHQPGPGEGTIRVENARNFSINDNQFWNCGWSGNPPTDALVAVKGASKNFTVRGNTHVAGQQNSSIDHIATVDLGASAWVITDNVCHQTQPSSLDVLDNSGSVPKHKSGNVVYT